MDRELLQAWVEDYEACKRGEDYRLVSGPCRLADESEGMLHVHGADDAACAATFSHASLGVALVCTGSREQVVQIARERKDKVFFSAEPVFRGARVRLFGHDRAFQPVRGRVVVGALEDEGATILLGFAGGQWALAWCEQGWSSWVIVSDDLGHVDLDAWRKLQQRGRRRESPSPPPPPPLDEAQLELERLRRRVLRREHIDVVAEQAEVVVACLDNLVEQAPGEGDQQLVDALCDLIVEASQKGLRANPVGRKSYIARIFSRYVGRPVSHIFIGLALAAARRLAWPFVSLCGKRAGVKGRTWALDLVAAADAKDPLHRRLLTRAAAGFDLTGAHRRPTTASQAQRVRTDPAAYAARQRGPGGARKSRAASAAEPPPVAPTGPDAPAAGEERRAAEAEAPNPAAEQIARLEAELSRREAAETALRAELDDQRRRHDERLAAVLAERDQLATELATHKEAEERIVARLQRLEDTSRRLEALEQWITDESGEAPEGREDTESVTCGPVPPDVRAPAAETASGQSPGDDKRDPAIESHNDAPAETSTRDTFTRTWPRRPRSPADMPARAWVLASLGPAVLTWHPAGFVRPRGRPRGPRDDSG